MVKNNYYSIEFINCTSVDYKFTIVVDIEQVMDYLLLVDEDIQGSKEAKIAISSVRMTQKEYLKWFKDNVKP